MRRLIQLFCIAMLAVWIQPQAADAAKAEPVTEKIIRLRGRRSADGAARQP